MNNVKQLRVKAGLWQRELAEAIGVCEHAISAWERNKRDPSGENLLKLESLFGTPVTVEGRKKMKVVEHFIETPLPHPSPYTHHGGVVVRMNMHGEIVFLYPVEILPCSDDYQDEVKKHT